MNNLFELDFLSKMGTLLKESYQFKKYKAMHPVLAVFTGIFMLPFLVLSFFLTAILAVFGYIYALAATPVRFMHSLIHKEGESVRFHASEFVIYFLSWVTIIWLYLLLAFLFVVIVPLYTALAIVLYIQTLGGFRFHVFPYQYEDISIEVNGRLKQIPLWYVITYATLFVLLPIIHAVVYFFILYFDYSESYFLMGFFGIGGIYSIYNVAQFIFSLLYSLIFFARNPREKKAIEPEVIPESFETEEQ